MSNSRQLINDPSVVRFWMLDHPNADVVVWPSLEWPMLAYAESGVMCIESASERWIVPPHRAMWIPAGERWTMASRGAVRVRSLYFAPGTFSRASGVVEVRPFLRELIREACRVGPLTKKTASERSLVSLLTSELVDLGSLPYSLPMPGSAPDFEVAERFVADPKMWPDVASLAESESVSVATLDRRFRKSVRLSAGRWMLAARLHVGLREVMSGAPVSDAAFVAGYSGASAFGAAFRRHFGMTPAEARACTD